MLPEGLELCRWCGDIRGEGCSCLCEGITCSYCRAGRIHRPITDQFDPVLDKWWHTPYFGNRAPCASCRALAHAIAGPTRTYPGPISKDPRVRRVLHAVRAAAIALTADDANVRPDGAGPYVVAVRGDVVAWSAVTDDPAQASRPLWAGLRPRPDDWDQIVLGRFVARTGLRGDALRAWLAEHTKLAAWACADGVLARQVALELRERWRPPLVF